MCSPARLTWKVFSTLALICGGLGASSANAKTCEFAVHATDDISYDVKDIKLAKDCTIIKINFKHTGTVLKHNWVLVKKSDLERIRKDGEVAGDAHNYLPKGGGGVIAQSKLIEPGVVSAVEFPASQVKKGVDYVYFCSFPGHGATMKGTLRFQP